MVLRPSSTRSSRLFILLLHIFSPLTSRLSLLTSSVLLPFPPSPSMRNSHVYWLQSPSGDCLSEDGWGSCDSEALWKTERDDKPTSDDMFNANPEEYMGVDSYGELWRIRKYDPNEITTVKPRDERKGRVSRFLRALNSGLYRLPLPVNVSPLRSCLVLSRTQEVELGQCHRPGWLMQGDRLMYEGDGRGKRSILCVKGEGGCEKISFIPFKVERVKEKGTPPNFDIAPGADDETLKTVTSKINRTSERITMPSSLLHPPLDLHPPSLPPLKKEKFENKIHMIDMPVNPYSVSSGNYIDPLTSLIYPVHRNGESLVGVGQYYRTILRIKVYGVALYVKGEEVMGDESMKKFAGRSKEDLRSDESFYKCLRNMACDEESLGGRDGFARTIMLKLNMQLSTDTMRSSLEADWELLSAEHKRAMTESSFRPRPAGKKVLEDLKEGRSMCTCGQIAPVQYEKADKECCARGTELSFGWKGDEVVVRLNGEYVDSFNDASMAKGIFYEYMRGDDPISPDAREHFPDGFPSILAPLTQFSPEKTPKFMTNSKMMAEKPTSNGKKENNNMVKMLAANLSERAAGAREATQQGLKNALFHIQRPKATLSAVAGSIHSNAEDAVSQARGNIERVAGEIERLVFKKKSNSKEGTDQEVVKEEEELVEEENNSTVVYAVHLYLILLLMVSLPMGSFPSGGDKRLLRRRRTTPTLLQTVSPHTLSMIEEGVELKRGRGLSIADEKEAVPKMRKSLSYYL
ncbi:hypothetical protein TrVE_jg3666 [Triparma verrucosa]|uniref:Uncharacterized protein n=1 Tax=Triparma verrucosa TaxID=1606542 RepID=A0A9W7BXU0_9STRA|nr:hypothetical protein TrVE_jg3666 [Triparma verrucosa]